MQCPSCGHEAPQAEFGEQLKCPVCDVFYAKALAAKQRASAGIEVAPSPSAVSQARAIKERSGKAGVDAQPVVVVDIQMRFWSMVVFMVKWTLAAIPALLILILIGVTATSFVSGWLLSTAINEPPASSATSPAAPPASSESSSPAAEVVIPLTTTLAAKDFVSGEYGQAEITFALDFHNKSGRAIRAFDGAATFTDLLGNSILQSKIAINDPVPGYGTLNWRGKIDYNQFIDRHERLRNEPYQNLKIRFELKKVLYDDGEIQTF